MTAATTIVLGDEREVDAEGLIPLLLAKWNVRARTRTKLEDATRAQLAGKMPTEYVEALIEQQIATEQATYLVEYFWLLDGLGCAAPDRMAAWIRSHNAMITRMWAEVLLEKTISIAKLLVADGRRLQQSQLVVELLGYLEKAQRRMVMGVGYGEPHADECLRSVDSAVTMLRDLNGDARPCPKHHALLVEFEARRRWPGAPPSPRRKRRLERLLDEAYFGSLARHVCTARLDGTHVILGSSDVERFMMHHMDPKLCRERLRALSEAGFLEERLLSNDRCSTVRLFRPTELLEEVVAEGLKPLRVLLRMDAVCRGRAQSPCARCTTLPFHGCPGSSDWGELCV